MTRSLSRRRFLKTTSLGAASTFAAPAFLSAKSPNETVRVAGVGVGGKGWTDINGAAKHAQVAAFCDVDTGKNRRGGFGNAAEAWPQAKAYVDFRRMLDKEHKQLDAVTISTPDHMHAPATMLALQHGLAVYTQKPLTRTLFEARALTQAAAKAGVSTQMGNQGHSGSGYRTLAAIIQSGAIGKIKMAHTWSNRPIWPQGQTRPAGSDPIPSSLNWDLWLGGAPQRPFKQGLYHPFKWRGWFDFGAGALGDMGCHIIDPVVWSLELGAPTSVSYVGPKPMPETFPQWEILRYRFPGTKHTSGKEIGMTWSDGGKLPPLEGTDIPLNTELPKSGVILVGEQGTLLCKHGGAPALYPLEKFQDANLPSVGGLDHYQVWIDGVKTGKAPNSSFAYSGPLTETVLLGVVASRVGALETLKWDAEKLAFTNSDLANRFVHEDYRAGWKTTGL